MGGMGGMDFKNMKPCKFEYFELHGRACMVRMLLGYAKYCMWKDCPMTMEDFAKNKASGYLKYGQMPMLTLGDGMQLT